MATQQETERAVAALLAQAGSAHGAYEERDLGGVYDQNWPDWYAAYLVEHSLGRLLGRAVAVRQLSGFLKRCDEEYKSENPAASWPDYYARRLIAWL
jgi:hypothetical protein